jgi:hypothetical protein
MVAGIAADPEGVTIVATPLDSSPVHDATRICPVADAGSWPGLDWSPAADAFVIANQDDRLHERIQTVRPRDCRIETLVSSDRGRLQNARWGPDGKRIYYLEGSTLRKVATGTSPAALPVSVREHTGRFSLSTSGLLAYEQRTSYANLSLVAAGTPSTIRPLTEGTHLNTAPAPSPDGTRVAFTRQGNVYIVSADATSTTRVPHEFATATAVAWSPDGLRLAVLTSQGATASLWIVDPQGGSARSFDVSLLRPGRPDRVQWVSSGTVVIWGAPSSTAMTALDLTSGERTVLWSSQSPGEFALVPSAQVSPDLTRAAVRFEQGGIVMVHVFSLAAGGARFERMLLREPRGVGGAVIGWSEDNWVYVLRENGRDIVKIPSTGGRPVPVLTVPDSLRKVNEIRMSSRGEPFVAVTAESLSDIWVVDGFDP